MIELVKREIESIADQNKDHIYSQFGKLKYAYDTALTGNIEDQAMEEASFDKVDSRFVQDISSNLDWYLENYNDVLLNVSYPSKQEKEFLKHVE